MKPQPGKRILSRLRKKFPGCSVGISLRFSRQGMTIDTRDAAPDKLLLALPWEDLEEYLVRFWPKAKTKR